jgi:hypothetical protein
VRFLLEIRGTRANHEHFGGTSSGVAKTADSMAEVRVCCETISALNREEYRDFAVVKGSAAIIPFGFSGDFALLIKFVTGNNQGRFCRRTL